MHHINIYANISKEFVIVVSITSFKIFKLPQVSLVSKLSAGADLLYLFSVVIVDQERIFPYYADKIFYV